MVGGLPVWRRVGTAGGSNRRIRKTVCPVVWEGAGAQSPSPDPIVNASVRSTQANARGSELGNQ